MNPKTVEPDRANARDAILAEISRIITSTPTIEEVYPLFARQVGRILPFDRIAINIVRKGTGRVSSQFVDGLPVEGRHPGDEFPFAGSATAMAVESRRGILVPTLTDEEIAARLPGHLPVRRAGIKTTLMAPLIARGEAFGALVLMSATPDRYAEIDIPTIETVAAQISGAVANALLLAEHRRMTVALQEREASLRSIFSVAPIGIGVVSAERTLTQVNERICRMVGRPREELLGRSSRILYPDERDFDYVGRAKYAQIRKSGSGTVETRWQRADGRVIDILLSSTPLDPGDETKGVTFTALDITERKRSETELRALETRLRQAQKMEAIGTLAGGIAHDFNNILAAIIGYTELSKIESTENPALSSNLNDILKAALRARDLVRQILMFSRQAQSEFGPVQVHRVVQESLSLLKATLPTTIRIRQDLATRATILGDATQIHQVVMNLGTNAFHAMRAPGGLLDVSLSETLIADKRPPELDHLTPGRYLRLTVSDTGHGIDPAIMHRLFDPYFTTKPKGEGTGLGLAVVHGIVKHHGGGIQVHSQLGAGTSFDLYFPVMAEQRTAAAPVEVDPAAGGRERILFVDDEPAIAELGKRLLESLGYRVTSCKGAIEALDRFRSDPLAYDLLITDMTMPQMTGDRLAAALTAIRPGLPVIVCTGFSELIGPERAREIGIQALIMKPFLKGEMAEAIRAALEPKTA
ncbi:MAG: ATP-binding protein [Desulfobacterales bacterium]|nr:ATP-binding protein [Desulfobacterales bacterium]